MVCFLLVSWTSVALAASDIPKAAWSRPIGLPLENPGVTKDPGMIDDGYWQGAPVGGMGAGTFSRSYRGDFSRWHIKAGVHKYETVYVNEFAMFQKSEGDATGTARVLMTDHPRNGELSSWAWDYPVGAGEYSALYPKSWYDYKWDKFPAHVVLEQYSPVLPNNYRESSYPVAVYRWHAENPTNHPVTVSVLLSWANMAGWFRTFTHDFNGTPNQGNYNQFVSDAAGSAGTMKGIVFDRGRDGGALNEWDGQFAIAALESPGVEVTYQTTFLAQGDGKAVWAPFAKDGRLANSNTSWVSDSEKLAGAIALRFTLQPGEKKIIPMVISWDLPVVQFGQGRKWNRRYTDFYGASGNNAWKIARDGLLNATTWSDAIDAWQAPYVNDESKPLWYRGMLFNELYTLADGGTFWGRQAGSDKKGAVPHDLGVPEGDPFIAVNQPGWQDTNDWKDLNSKFVLMVYRDYVFTGRKDTPFLRETWPAVKEAIAYLRQFDHGGGVPENGGYPDQTYDSWVVRGVSAYSGGLWLAALRAGEETARSLGDKATQETYHQLFHKAQQTYISKLWNGEYFRYDTESENQNAIQADQLAGQWYANMLGLGDLVPHEMQVSAAKKIFEVNVMKFAGGQMGAANGINADGSAIDNVQAKEVWAGTTLGFAALLLSEGMKDEAYKSAWGLYHVIYETKGYWFRTPEAWDITGNFRAGMYMRPAGVWAMEMTQPPTKP
jgi:uncharacterized protein (DUF608 family)